MDDIARKHLTGRSVARAALLTAVAAALVSLHAGREASAENACTLDRATGTTIDAKPFVTNAYLSRWNVPTNTIAEMGPDAAGYYRVFTIRPDGSGRRELTDGTPGVPSKHQGMESWHPSGRYLLFAAEKPEWSSLKLFGSPDYEALPGFGLHDDLWLITSDGKRAWQLTHDPNTKTQGILMAVFSPDGKHIAWSERQPDKSWRLEIADFVEKPEPHLGTIRTYQPGGGKYFEPGSFSSDGKSLLYTSDQGTHNFWLSQIYRFDLATGSSTRLTQGETYNEHPIAMKTPTGDEVVYMSVKGNHRFPFRLTLGTDFWAMRLDGSQAKRLTTMNVAGSPESTGAPQVAITSALSSDGTSMLGDVQDSLAKQTGLVHVVRFTCP